MKWSLGQHIVADGKTDGKRWPFVRLDDAGHIVAARSYYGSEPAEGGLSSKVLAYQPDAITAPLLFHDRAKRFAYTVSFARPDWRYRGDAERYLEADPSMYRTVTRITETADGNGEWTTVLSEIARDGCDLGDDTALDGGPYPRLGKSQTWPQVRYDSSFQCRRVLIYDPITHNGTAYPNAILRAPAGTVPPAGPRWRLRPKPNAQSASDTRFEPFAYPAVGSIYPRWGAAYGDGTEANILAADATPDNWLEVTACATIEEGIDGQAILCKAAWQGQVGSDAPHLLIIEAAVFTVTRWRQESQGGETVKTRNVATFGIFGRAIAVI